jgi:transcriptional regulator with XRE-family HTH domain
MEVTVFLQIRPYDGLMARRQPTKQRPAQGAHLLKLRERANLSQVELAELVGEPQVNISFWERCAKPPRSDVLPKLAKVLGVSVEELLTPSAPIKRRAGPVGKLQRVFEEAAELPRSQQDQLIQVVQALVTQFKHRAA